MKSEEIEKIWQDIEAKKATGEKAYQRIVCIDMLYRIYIGSVGIPSNRYLSIEIPEADKGQFDTFSAPKGFTFTFSKPAVRHDGFVACVLQAASHDQNDVFTIVAADILHELVNQKQTANYIDTLKQRIAKWRDFFRNPASKKLSEEMIIGLWGELNLICKMHDSGISIISDLWNGPIKSAQDFQGKYVAIEVKTTTDNALEYVNISSEMQLDDEGKELFLVVYRIERNDASGVTLPQFVEKIANNLTEQQKKRFFAALMCLGYLPEDSGSYNKGYVVKELNNYQVREGFPRLRRSNMPQGVHDLKYRISLSNCSAYLTEWDVIISSIEEHEYGQS